MSIFHILLRVCLLVLEGAVVADKSMMVSHLGLLRFGSELWSGPEPSQTRPKFGPRFRVGAELDQRSRSRFGVGLNLAEPFRTGSEP